jgi:hypothetical protein
MLYFKIKTHKRNENNFRNYFEKSIFFQFSHIILFKQLEIQPMSNIARPGVMFLRLPIVGGCWLDLFPYTVQCILNLKQQSIHFLIAARIRGNIP